MSPLFSIIVPVYNASLFISRCMEGFLEQTCRDFELICVDDGSQDDSLSLLQQYAARDSRIRVIHQKNAGVSAARNKGLAIASGQIIGFCDADDCYTRDALQQVKRVFAENECDLVVTGFIHVNTEGVRFSVSVPGETVSSAREIQERMLYDGRIMGYSVNKFFRRELISGVLFCESYTHCEDMHFISQVLHDAPNARVMISPSLTYECYSNPKSATSDSSRLLDADGQLKYIPALTAIMRMYPGDWRMGRLVRSTLFRLLDVNSDFFQDRPDVVRGMAVAAMRYALPYLMCRKHQPLKVRIERVWQMIKRVLAR